MMLNCGTAVLVRGLFYEQLLRTKPVVSNGLVILKLSGAKYDHGLSFYRDQFLAF
jgi:hypothetical protein